MTIPRSSKEKGDKQMCSKCKGQNSYFHFEADRSVLPLARQVFPDIQNDRDLLRNYWKFLKSMKGGIKKWKNEAGEEQAALDSFECPKCHRPPKHGRLVSIDIQSPNPFHSDLGFLDIHSPFRAEDKCLSDQESTPEKWQGPATASTSSSARYTPYGTPLRSGKQRKSFPFPPITPPDVFKLTQSKATSPDWSSQQHAQPINPLEGSPHKQPVQFNSLEPYDGGLSYLSHDLAQMNMPPQIDGSFYNYNSFGQSNSVTSNNSQRHLHPINPLGGPPHIQLNSLGSPYDGLGQTNMQPQMDGNPNSSTDPFTSAALSHRSSPRQHPYSISPLRGPPSVQPQPDQLYSPGSPSYDESLAYFLSNVYPTTPDHLPSNGPTSEPYQDFVPEQVTLPITEQHHDTTPVSGRYSHDDDLWLQKWLECLPTLADSVDAGVVDTMNSDYSLGNFGVNAASPENPGPSSASLQPGEGSTNYSSILHPNALSQPDSSTHGSSQHLNFESSPYSKSFESIFE